MMFLLKLIVLCILLGFSVLLGYKLGEAMEKQRWQDKKKELIAGQRVWIKGLGEVLILGREEPLDGGSEIISYVPESFLQGRSPPEISDEELDANVITDFTEHFFLQVDHVMSSDFIH